MHTLGRECPFSCPQNFLNYSMSWVSTSRRVDICDGDVYAVAYFFRCANMPTVAEQIRSLYKSDLDKARLVTSEKVREPLSQQDKEAGESHASTDARTGNT